mgnify:CR=1 FL=1
MTEILLAVYIAAAIVVMILLGLRIIHDYFVEREFEKKAKEVLIARAARLNELELKKNTDMVSDTENVSGKEQQGKEK